MFPPSALDNAARLSTAARRFLEVVARTPALLAAETYAALTHLPLRYPVQPWPLLVDASLVASAREAAESSFHLVRKAPRRAFAGAPSALGQFYRGLDEPERLLRILERTDDLAHAVARTDLLLTDEGFRCIEMNLTGGLGGWDAVVAARALLGIDALSSLLEAEGVDVRPSNPLLDFLEHAADLAVRCGSADEELNLAVMVRSDDPIPEDDPLLTLFGIVDGMYGDVLRALHGRRGRVRLVGCDDVVPDGGTVRLDGARQHVLLEFSSAGMTETFAARELALVEGGRTVLLNGRTGQWLGDKRTMALAWRLDARGALDAGESTMLRRFIPWTALVEPGATVREGQVIDLLSTLDAHRERLVLKRGQGCGGKEVVVGAETPPAEWDRAVVSALADGDWVVQDLVPAMLLPLQHGADGWAMHRVVWGTFVLGGRAGGSFGRAAPCDGGIVVNAARGTKAVILEVASRR